MKHPEYDSPFVLNVNDIAAQMARNIDARCWQAVRQAGINVDADKLLAALNQDSKRYREAYKKGYETGYEKRDADIVRCRECKQYMTIHCTCDGCCISDDWFCADGERKDDDD